MAKINFTENLMLRGRLSFTVFKNGVPIRRFSESNLVVNTGIKQMAHMVTGDVEDSNIDRIALGTCGNVPTVNDTEIMEPYAKPIGSFEYPEINKVKFNWKFEMSEANGMEIKEFGLLTVDGELFARCVCTGEPILWESDISLEGEWTLAFGAGG